VFARWLFVRLSAAEKALRQGRIDEAYAAATQPELRQQARGERLLDELVKPLVARARLHRQAGRWGDALADLDRLVAVGRATPEVQALRQQVVDEMRAHAGEAAEHQEAVARAAQAAELDARMQRASQLLGQAGQALVAGDVLAGARYWQEAGQRGRSQATDQFAVRLANACREAIERWVDEGRIDCLGAARTALGALAPIVPTVIESERLVDLCQRAVRQFSADDYAGLRETLLRLKAARGGAEWVKTALSAVANITAGREALLASPLGLFASLSQPARPGVAPAATAQAVTGNPAMVGLERPLLVLVDGGGSGLLVRRDLVRVGRGGSAAVDVPIPGDLQSHHADIIRRGEDYFLTAYGPAQVNGRRVEHTLLRDGDRIALGASVRMVFCRPSVKSESAVLRLSHRCRLAQDVSDVVLFRDTCLVGPTASCHLRTHEGHGQAVLFERGGGLHARQTAGADWQMAAPRAVQAGAALELGDVRVTVKPYAT
jgi:predicted pyridoxine 5'-phosphate oxidase superfamily flavin-nucleotide-binding protein